MMSPSVGRQVWYKPSIALRQIKSSTQPFAATVCYVWSDVMVNLLVINEYGMQTAMNSITLAQDRPALEGECEWMPYQVKQNEKNQMELPLVNPSV